MSSIRVKGHPADTVVSRYYYQAQELSKLITQLSNRRASCRGIGKDFEEICRALDKTINKLEGSMEGLHALHQGLSSVLETYSRCEVNLAGGNYDLGLMAETGATASEDAGYTPNVLSLIWKMIGAVGPAGGMVSTIGGFLTGEQSAADWAKLVKGVVGSVGKGLKASAKTDATWKSILFGGKKLYETLDIAENASRGTIFKTSIKKGFSGMWDNLTFKGVKNASGGKEIAGEACSSAAQWIGVVTTFVTNGMENIEEYKSGKIDGGRAFGETIIESGVDIALGAVAGAAAGVVLGAGAPAIAVGAVAAGAVWVANTACEWITSEFFGEKKNIGEVVADGAYALAEGVGELGKGVVEVAGKAVDAAVDAGKAVAKWFDSLF